MAVQTVIFSAAHSKPAASYVVHSSFLGVSVKSTPRKVFSLSAVAPKLTTVVAAAKKAVAVLKGNSAVEGVVTLTQEDDGAFLYC